VKQNRERPAISYAWVILALLFLGQAAAFGTRASFGAYIAPWEQDFAISRTVVTSISMLNFLVFALGQPLVGKLNDLFGRGIVPTVCVFFLGAGMLLTSQANHIWQVYLLYGVAFSLGIAGTCSSLPGVIVTKWFVEKRGIALGLVTAGLAVGQLVIVPANLFMIERLGWRTAMATVSIIIMAVVGPLFIFFLRSKPEEKGIMPYGYQESSNDEDKTVAALPDEGKTLASSGVFRQRVFWLISISYFICGFTDVGMIGTHLIPIAQGKSIPVSGVAFAISLIAIVNIAGAIVTGLMSDHFNRKRQLAVIYSVRAASFALLIVLQQPWLLLLFAAIFGAVEMASVAPVTSLTAELFSKYSVGTILGFVALAHQLGGAVGSWAPGILYDITDSYTVILTISIVLLLASSGLSLLLPETRRKRSQSPGF